MTERVQGEPLRDWLVRAEADAEDLARSAQAENDKTTTDRAQAKAWAYRRVLAEVERGCLMVIDTSVPTDGTVVRVSISRAGGEAPRVDVAMRLSGRSFWMGGVWLPLTVTTDPAEAHALIAETTNQPVPTGEAGAPDGHQTRDGT